MANHKRKRPKHRRSGCLLCKPHKLTANAKAARRRERRAAVDHEMAADGSRIPCPIEPIPPG